MVEYINEFRTRHGLKPVRESPSLHRAAQRHAEDMLERRYFAHTSPNGDNVAERSREYTRDANGWRLGENLEWGSSNDLHQVLKAWVGSPPHRANLLERGYKDVGVGVAAGEFGGVADATVLSLTLGARS
jgi:uncharacterized protein YkwD